MWHLFILVWKLCIQCKVMKMMHFENSSRAIVREEAVRASLRLTANPPKILPWQRTHILFKGVLVCHAACHMLHNQEISFWPMSLLQLAQQLLHLDCPGSKAGLIINWNSYITLHLLKCVWSGRWCRLCSFGTVWLVPQCQAKIDRFLKGWIIHNSGNHWSLHTENHMRQF